MQSPNPGQSSLFPEPPRSAPARIIRSVHDGPDGERVVEADRITADKLPPVMTRRLALAFLAQQLQCSRRTLYRNGVADQLPTRFMGIGRRREGGGTMLTTRRVPKDGLLRLLDNLLNQT